MARIDFDSIKSGSSTIKQFMNYYWSSWSYSSTHAYITLYITSGGLMSPSKLYPANNYSQMQLSAIVNQSSPNIYGSKTVVTYRNVLKANGSSPISINSDLYASNFTGSYEFSFNIQSSDPPSFIYLISGLNGLPVGYVTNAKKLNLPGGYSKPYGTPTGSTSVYNITQTSATRSALVGTWGNYASAGGWYWNYGAGNYNISSGGSTYKNLYGLTPSTTYSYKFYIYNSAGKNRTYYGTFRTLNYTPPTSYISYNSVTNNSMTVNYSVAGTSVSQIRVYLNGSLWKTISTTNANGTITVTGLAPKTGYNISIQAYTSVGGLWGNQTANIYGTTYPNPVYINSAYISELTPFTAILNVVSNAPGDTDLYGYTLLDEDKNVVTSEVTSGSANYNYTNLIPEKTYYARVRIRTRSSNVWSSYVDIVFTTPADQASVFLKLYGVWRRGKVWIRLNDEWIVAKNIYIRKNDYWHKNNNF